MQLHLFPVNKSRVHSCNSAKDFCKSKIKQSFKNVFWVLKQILKQIHTFWLFIGILEKTIISMSCKFTFFKRTWGFKDFRERLGQREKEVKKRYLKFECFCQFLSSALRWGSARAGSFPPVHLVSYPPFQNNYSFQKKVIHNPVWDKR